MTSISNLTNNFMQCIKNDDYNTSDLINLLTGVSEYINDPTFSNNLIQIVDIIIEDRNSDNKFSIADLELLGKNTEATTSLVTAILLFVAAIPGVKLEYNEGASEEFIFKVLAYVFLIIVPNRTGQLWTYKEKQAVVQLMLTMHQLIKSSKLLKKLTSDVSNWFKTKKLCACTNPSSKEDVLEKKLPIMRGKLSGAVKNLDKQI